MSSPTPDARTTSEETQYKNQRTGLVGRINENAKIIIGGDLKMIQRPYKPRFPPVRPDDPEWRRLSALQEKIAGWDIAQKTSKTAEAKAEARYAAMMECRRDFPKFAEEWEEPEMPNSMKPRDLMPAPEPVPEPAAQPEARTMPVAKSPVAVPPLQAPTSQAPPIQASIQQGQSARAQSILLPGVPSAQNQPAPRAQLPIRISLLTDEDEAEEDRKRIKRERDDDYDPLRSPPPRSSAGPSPGPTSAADNASKPKKKRQRTEDFANKVRSQDPADLRYLRKRIVNKHEAQLMQIDHQLEKLGASVEGGGNEG